MKKAYCRYCKGEGFFEKRRRRSSFLVDLLVTVITFGKVTHELPHYECRQCGAIRDDI